MKVLSILGVILLVASVCSAATLRVPSEYAYVYDAVDAAQNGDTILVANGTHYIPPGQELIFNILQKDNITIVSESGPESTILDGQNVGSSSKIQISSGCIVQGFTFQNLAHYAIDIDNGYGHVVRNCRFTYTGSVLIDENSGCSVVDCDFGDESGGITSFGSSDVESCSFTGGRARIYIMGGATNTINNCHFWDIGWAPVIIEGDGNHTISNCVITGNGHHGIVIDHSEYATILIINNTIACNEGIGVYAMMGSPIISHNIITNNVGSGVAVEVTANPSFQCNDVWGNSNYANGNYVGFISDQTGYNGNISVDPLFCNPDLDDYSVDVASPVLSQDCGVMGALPDPGCSNTAVAEKSWGAIKSMYR